MPRKTGKLKGNKTFLIVVEGPTEKIYFSDVKTNGHIPGVTVNPKIAKHSDLNTILKTAVTEIKTDVYDSVWCVFDRDTIVKEGMSKELKKQYENAKSLGIRFADSMPAFEVWFLLHFAMPAQFYSSQDRVIKELKKHIADYEKDQKWLTSANLYSKLKPYFKDAMKKAAELDKKKKVSENANATISHVYKFFEELLKETQK